MRRIPATTILAITACLAAPAAANACSCIPPDIERDLPAADAAVVGTVVESSGTEQHSMTTLRVEHVPKGDIGDTVEVRSADNSAACGLTFPNGERVGLLLTRGADGGWSSGLCQVVDADELAAVAPSGPVPERPSSSGSLLERLLAALARLCRGR